MLTKAAACIYLIKNIVKTVILLNIITTYNFLFECVFKMWWQSWIFNIITYKRIQCL